jgi:transcriptional regulator with XRE-family HTH domain
MVFQKGGKAMNLGALVRDRRQAHFMSQKELGALLDVTWGTVQRWETNKSLPFPAQQRRLLEALNITPEELRAALKESEAENVGKPAA